MPTMPGSNEIRIESGAVIAYRLFDIAYAIDLPKVEALWARQAKASTRARLTATPPKAMAFGVPPVALALEPIEISLPDRPVQASVTARLYDFGAVTLALRVPVRDMAWSGFSRLTNDFDAAVGTEGEAPVWRRLLAGVRATVAEALIRPTSQAIEEDFLAAVVFAFDAPLTATELLQRADLVPLLSGEQRPLSEASRTELLRQRFSYYTDDLTVLTWDRAFVCEPRGETDVLEVLEVANAQLLEMRYYDELLDAELPRMYDLVEGARRLRPLFAARRTANLARRFYALVAEVTELTERVDNALQVTEDVYLARIYAAALELFRVRPVTAAVERKLAIIRDTYTALYEESSGGRAELMEFTIVVLILLELLAALTRHGT